MSSIPGVSYLQCCGSLCESIHRGWLRALTGVISIGLQRWVRGRTCLSRQGQSRKVHVCPQGDGGTSHILQTSSHGADTTFQDIWGSAARQYELLNGLVDLRDAELGVDLHSFTNDDQRGTKRPAGSDTSPLESTSLFSTSSNFDSRLLGKAGSALSMGPIRKPRRRSSSGSARVKTETRASNLAGSPIIAEELSFPNIHLDGALGGGMFSHFAPSPVSHEGAHQSYELLGDVGPVLDLSQFRSPPGTSGGVTNFTDLCVPLEFIRHRD